MTDIRYLWLRIPGIIAILVGVIADIEWLMMAGFGWWMAVMICDYTNR